TGAYQTALAGGSDAFVTKFKPAGNTLAYSTYLGGGNTDQGNGIAVDTSGNAYIAGYTASTNFPTASAYQASLGGGTGHDAFITKLNSAGSALGYSTYLGGGGTDAGQAIVVNKPGNAFLTGYTGSTNFPTANAYQASLSGGAGQDAFVTELGTAGNSLSYST